MADAYQRTDEELIEDFLDGDTGAFRLLVERYHDPLLRFLFRLTGERSTAEDVFQDAFLQVHQSIETFDPTRRFKPWLFTIAANKARDTLRKQNRRAAVSLSTKPRDSESGSLIDLFQIDLPGPEFRLEKEEQGRMVQRAVDAMSPRLREILLLAYFQRMSYQQIAEALDIPLGTVKSRLHAAVAAFARQWQEQAENLKGEGRTKGAEGREH